MKQQIANEAFKDADELKAFIKDTAETQIILNRVLSDKANVVALLSAATYGIAGLGNFTDSATYKKLSALNNPYINAILQEVAINRGASMPTVQADSIKDFTPSAPSANNYRTEARYQTYYQAEIDRSFRVETNSSQQNRDAGIGQVIKHFIITNPDRALVALRIIRHRDEVIKYLSEAEFGVADKNKMVWSQPFDGSKTQSKLLELEQDNTALSGISAEISQRRREVEEVANEMFGQIQSRKAVTDAQRALFQNDRHLWKLVSFKLNQAGMGDVVEKTKEAVESIKDENGDALIDRLRRQRGDAPQRRSTAQDLRNKLRGTGARTTLKKETFRDTEEYGGGMHSSSRFGQESYQGMRTKQSVYGDYMGVNGAISPLAAPLADKTFYKPLYQALKNGDSSITLTLKQLRLLDSDIGKSPLAIKNAIKDNGTTFNAILDRSGLSDNIEALTITAKFTGSGITMLDSSMNMMGAANSVVVVSMPAQYKALRKALKADQPFQLTKELLTELKDDDSRAANILKGTIEVSVYYPRFQRMLETSGIENSQEAIDFIGSLEIQGNGLGK